ncbi:hypothetical protein [Aquimarina sp. 433]
MNPLQKSLQLNALFSSISGILMVFLNQQIATLFGINNYTPFWVIGLLLLYFAMTIWFEIKKQRTPAVVWIIIQDFIWVIGSILLIMFKPFGITETGNIIIGIIAFFVLCMGINQILGLRKTYKSIPHV